MTASYEPAHDPAVHGPAYAVKESGHDTQPFTAVRPFLTAGHPPNPGCRCDEHKYGQRPGTDAVLYTGPDAVMLLIHGAIRDGRYEDVHAYADEAQHAIAARFDAVERRYQRTLAPAIRAWQRWRAAEDAKQEAA
jgi:hypothetical protein